MSWFKKISQIKSQKLNSIIKRWESQGITLFVYETENKIIVHSLIVPKGQRKQGIGSQIMRELTNYADQIGKRIELTTGVKDPYHGTTSQKRLINFYKRFGLVHNKGRNKDYTINNNMYREPQKRLEQ